MSKLWLKECLVCPHSLAGMLTFTGWYAEEKVWQLPTPGPGISLLFNGL